MGLMVEPQTTTTAKAWGVPPGFRASYINPVPPEQAAAYLRETEVDLHARGRG
jgi:hypothetical protein